MAFEWAVSGNLGNDPRPFTTNSGKSGVNVTLCCNVPIDKREGETEPQWIDAVLFGWMGEVVENCKKGDGLRLRGYVKRKYYNYNGEERAVWSMLVNDVVTQEMFFKKADRQERQQKPVDLVPDGHGAGPSIVRHGQQTAEKVQPQDFDDDIPF